MNSSGNQSGAFSPAFSSSLALFGLVVLALGCNGNIEFETGSGDRGDSESAIPGDGQIEDSGPFETEADPYVPSDDVRPCSADYEPRLVPLLRLTRQEYNNTIHQVLGVSGDHARDFLPEEAVDGFITGSPISSFEVELYSQAAERIAAEADISALVDCTLSSPACAEQFVRDISLRLLRHPLSQDQIDRLLSLYELAEEPERGIRLALEMMLQMPQFIYHIETEPTEQAVEGLTNFEIAARLSYLLTASAPDEPLMGDAIAGQLEDETVLESHARRLLGKASSASAVSDFFVRWFHVDLKGVEKSDTYYPEYAGVAQDLEVQRDRFFESIATGGPGSYEALWTRADYPTNASLAEVYAPDENPDGWEQLDHGPVRAAGALALPAFLSRHANPDRSSPIQRGVLVREQFLCQTLPAPPEDVNAELPPPETGLSTRVVAEQHRADPACAGCHTLIDPIGFVFENFDAIGRYRETEEGSPVDATGEITETADTNGPLDGLRDLAHRLSESSDVLDCTAQKWFRFSMRRAPTAADACVIHGMKNDIVAAQGDIHALIVRSVLSPSFLTKKRELQ